MMRTAQHIGRVGALAVALGVMAAAGPLSTASAAEPPPPPPATALLVCGTGCPKLHDADVDLLMDQFVTPTHPGQTITPIAVTTPEEFWPVTGVLRAIAFVTGDPRLFGPGGAAWPDEPLWKLSGFFDLTADQSVDAGADDLEAAMADYGNDHLIIYGNSQGAGVANVVKKRLDEKYPEGTTAPDIDFVLGSDPNIPNGGLASRFPGLYIPILDLSFNGPASTDTQFDTFEIIRQYDGAADLPLYPLNFVADANAVMGFFYLHTNPFDVSLAPGAPAPKVTTDPTGKTHYYFFETKDLPLFAPLRAVGVPEPVIDVFEPFVKVIVEQGYDRSIPLWEPTPARLIPPLHPAKLATDLVDAVGEGIDNAAALVKPLSSSNVSAGSKNSDVDDDITQAESPTNESVVAVKSLLGGGRSVAQTGDTDNDSAPAKPARKTPLRDAVVKVRADVRNAVTQVSDTVKKALGIDRHKADSGRDGDSGATPQ